MKNNCRKALATLALTLALTSSAFADDGIIHTGIAAPPPPPTNGVMHTGAAAPTPEASDGLMEIALSLLQGLLARF